MVYHLNDESTPVIFDRIVKGYNCRNPLGRWVKKAHTRYTVYKPRIPTVAIHVGVMINIIPYPYAIYGNIYHQYTPFVLAYIPYMDPDMN